MGIYDREYLRDERPPGIDFGQQSMVTRIVIVNAAVFLLNFLDLFGKDDWLSTTMAVEWNTIVQPWMWWKFLTAGFAHAADPQHILFNMLGLWFLGKPVEQALGKAEFLRFYLMAVVLGNIAWTTRQYLGFDPNPGGIALGASGAVTAVVMLFVFKFPRQTVLLFFVLPVPAWVLGVLVIVMNVWGVDVGTIQGARVAHDVHLVGAAFAAAYSWFNWNLGRVFPSFFRPFSFRKLKSKPKLKVHDPEGYYRELDEEADRILDKLHTQGEDSLTARERRTLESYSRRMRQKHG